LLAEARRLFATQGVFQTTSREIVEAAGQRNVSALTYHFGSREGVLRAILLGFDEVLDAERGQLLAGIGEGASTRQLVAALLVPYARPLATVEGREYLRIVAQLTSASPSGATPPSPARTCGGSSGSSNGDGVSCAPPSGASGSSPPSRS